MVEVQVQHATRRQKKFMDVSWEEIPAVGEMKKDDTLDDVEDVSRPQVVPARCLTLVYCLTEHS